jgi:hypothetical protein
VTLESLLSPPVISERYREFALKIDKSLYPFIDLQDFHECLDIKFTAEF